jgi:hypothetical protein
MPTSELRVNFSARAATQWLGPAEQRRVHQVVELRSGEPDMAAIERQWVERIASYERRARTPEVQPANCGWVGKLGSRPRG